VALGGALISGARRSFRGRRGPPGCAGMFGRRESDEPASPTGSFTSTAPPARCAPKQGRSNG
jgi:hypothetical protein